MLPLLLLLLTAGAAPCEGPSCDLLAGINAVRSTGAVCGGQRLPPSAPLRPHAALDAAAATQARWVAAHGRLQHTTSEGSCGDRADRAGYDWKRVGENLALGQESARQVVRGWLASPSHCAAMLDPRMKEAGVAISRDRAGRRAWVLVLGARR